MNDQGGWVFISHSHLDIEIVRMIRNKLEELGFNPLAFYLKCLSDEDEIEDLIKREIRVRDWFVFVNSENARKSHWVETERDYIEEIGGKNVCVINADCGEPRFSEILTNLADHMRINVIYTKDDRTLAEQVEQILLSHDFSVSVTELETSLSDPARIETILEEQNGGFSLFLLTKRNLPTEDCLRALQDGFFHERKIMLVTEEDLDCDFMIVALFQSAGSLVSAEMSREAADRLYRAIRGTVKWNAHDFTTSQSFLSARTIYWPDLETIGDYAFSDCTVLEEVYLPDSVVYISGKAFEGRNDVLVHCHAGSHAERFCKKRHMRYTTEY